MDPLTLRNALVERLDDLPGRKALKEALLSALWSGGSLLVEHYAGLPVKQSVERIAKTLNPGRPGSICFASIRCSRDIGMKDFIDRCSRPENGESENRRILPSVLLFEDIGNTDLRLNGVIGSLLENGEFNFGDLQVRTPEVFLLVGEQDRADHDGKARLHHTLAGLFSLRITLEAPSKEEELKLLEIDWSGRADLPPAIDRETVAAARNQVRDRLPISKDLLCRAIEFARILDQDDRVMNGGRPSIAALRDWSRLARTSAFFRDAPEVTWDDFRKIAHRAIDHRIRRETRTIATATQIVDDALARVQPAIAGDRGAGARLPVSGGEDEPRFTPQEAYDTVCKPMLDWMEKLIAGRRTDGGEYGAATLDLLLLTLFAGGHLLLEDYPGSGKSFMAKNLGITIDDDLIEEPIDIVSYNRIQCTPDLLPSDITGYMMLEEGRMRFRRGPVFAYVLLVDEINRTTPKVQSALLQAMGERQVSIDDRTYDLSPFFFVMATQNPLDRVGTYELPQAQLDRFLFKRRLLPMTDPEAIRDIMEDRLHPGTPPKIRASHILATARALAAPAGGTQAIEVPEMVFEIVLKIADAVGRRCRPDYGSGKGENEKERFREGSRPSVRALKSLIPALKALAWMESEGAAVRVEPAHVRKLGCDWLRHRVLPAETLEDSELDELIRGIIDEAVEISQH